MSRFTELSVGFIVVIGVFWIIQAVYLGFMKLRPENVYKCLSKVKKAWLVSKILSLA